MAANIEIKAKIKDFARLKGLAAALSDTPGLLIAQEDIFFHVPRGRLKLRLLAPDRGVLIYYERDDAAGPKRSIYHLAETATPDALKTVLAAALGIRGVVRKQRLLYRAGPTRIHLDRVERLGAFLELEVVLGPADSAAQGAAIAAGLMRKLAVEAEDLIEVAYIDLLERADNAGQVSA